LLKLLHASRNLLAHGALSVVAPAAASARKNTPKKELPEDMVMHGFRCAGCGRALDDVRSCKYRSERFYCSEFCSEEDEPKKPWPSIWDYPTSPPGGVR